MLTALRDLSWNRAYNYNHIAEPPAWLRADGAGGEQSDRRNACSPAPRRTKPNGLKGARRALAGSWWVCAHACEDVRTGTAAAGRNSARGSGRAANHLPARKPLHQYLESNACTRSRGEAVLMTQH